MNKTTRATDAITAILEVRSRSLTTVVYEELERRILSGEIPAGERFNEQSLAQSLGVSRGPVREARRSLEHAGILVSIPGKGTFVRKVNRSELAENYDIRAMMTGFACARIAEAATSNDKDKLRRLVQEMDAASGEADDDRYYALNIRFHDLIMEIAGHKRAAQIYRDHVKETHLSRHLSLTQKDKMKESNAEHAAILAAILDGDAERARRAGETHVLSGKRRWIEATGGRDPGHDVAELGDAPLATTSNHEKSEG